MTIDWFTFVAQIINFLILIWLLKRFLYGPILNAMQKREGAMAGRQAEAADATAQAEAIRKDYELQLQQLNATRDKSLEEARQAADEWQKQQMQRSREEVATAKTQWQRSLAREKQTLLKELQLQVSQHATDVSRHLLQDLSDERLQTRLVERFLSELANADATTIEPIAAALRKDGLVIETSHDLSGDEQSEIVNRIQSLADENGGVDFRVNAKLVCGIELHAPGCKLAWSIRDALAKVESDLIDAVENAIPEGVA